MQIHTPTHVYRRTHVHTHSWCQFWLSNPVQQMRLQRCVRLSSQRWNKSLEGERYDEKEGWTRLSLDMSSHVTQEGFRRWQINNSLSVIAENQSCSINWKNGTNSADCCCCWFCQFCSFVFAHHLCQEDDKWHCEGRRYTVQLWLCVAQPDELCLAFHVCTARFLENDLIVG